MTFSVGLAGKFSKTTSYLALLPRIQNICGGFVIINIFQTSTNLHNSKYRITTAISGEQKTNARKCDIDLFYYFLLESLKLVLKIEKGVQP